MALASYFKSFCILQVLDQSGAPYFLPPYAARDFPPYPSMIANTHNKQQDYGGGSSYANFR